MTSLGSYKSAKILLILNGETVDSVIDRKSESFGPVEELKDFDKIAKISIYNINIDGARDEDGNSAVGVEIAKEVQSFKPTMVYLHAGVANNDKTAFHKYPLKTLNDNIQQQLVSVFSNSTNVQLVYIDASDSLSLATRLQTLCAIPCVVGWNKSQPAMPLYSMFFARAFWAMLRNELVTFQEAYAMAVGLIRAYCSRAVSSIQKNYNGNAGDRTNRNKVALPPIPNMLSTTLPELPRFPSVPEPVIQKRTGEKLASGRSFNQFRLIAPHAELRLMAMCLPDDVINSHAFGNLCEVLRSILVTQARTVTLLNYKKKELQQPKPMPSLLPLLLAHKIQQQKEQTTSMTTLQCSVKTASGIAFNVTVGCPDEFLKDRSVIEYGLRLSLSSDASALQLRLPDQNSNESQTIVSSNFLVLGTPCIELFAITSTWAAHVLRAMASSTFSGLPRVLIAAGIGAVSTTSVHSFNDSDKQRFLTLMTGNEARKLILAATSSFEDDEPQNAKMIFDAMDAAKGTSANAPTQTPVVAGSVPRPPSTMPPPAHATENLDTVCFQSIPNEEAFYADLAEFIESTHSDTYPPGSFLSHIATVTLNGMPIDLFSLYKQVCLRGGYAAASNRVDWKNTIFPTLKNYSSDHKLTAIGNILKHHYQTLLLEYERNHRDEHVQRDGCILCGHAGAKDSRVCTVCKNG